MAATVVSAVDSIINIGVKQFTITIPTSVDGTSGSTTTFAIPGAMSLVWSAVSTNFNGKTAELKASNDGTNFYALASASQLTSSGNKVVPQIECAYPYWQVTCTGAPTATLVVTVTANLIK